MRTRYDTNGDIMTAPDPKLVTKIIEMDNISVPDLKLLKKIEIVPISNSMIFLNMINLN